MESYITLSHLNDFIFCPRSIYFHQLYSIYNEQNYKQRPQITGTEAHSSIDNCKYSTKSTVLQGIEVYCEKYNIVGKIDIFDTTSGRLTERKKAITTIYDGYIFQVYAQFFALSEMGYIVKEIKIYDISHNKNHQVQLPTENESMFQKFESLIFNIQNYQLNDDSFKPIIEKCKNCIYSPLCDKSLC
jgi:CRISPR-associated protein Cas4